MTERAPIALTTITTGGVPLLVDARAAEYGVKVFFSSRIGGVSRGPFAQLNLSERVGDEPGAPADNRRLLLKAAGSGAPHAATALQVHGCDVLEVTAPSEEPVGTGDALIARVPGVPVGVMTADCVPILLAGDGAVAAVHAGWRGLASGVVGAAVAALGDVQAAWVGPSIRACCYEVGPEVTDAFRAAGLPVAAADRVDTGAGAIEALRQLGVRSVASTDVCTSCSPDYFSYRRDGLTGRQGGFIEMP